MTAQLVTLTGNLTAAPELRFGPSGVAVVRLSVACQDRYRDKTGEFVDGDTHFQRMVAFGQAAQNIAASLNRGNRVIVTGKLVTSSYEHKDDATGEVSTRYSTDFHIEDIGPSTKWSEVRVIRAERAPDAVPSEWTQPAAAGASEPPF